ncbi:MAG: hypothetical protein EXR71_05150 [Myxococcales bacterium]|nr:hypothetical protein [Myxococcales bacterium]
MILVALLACPDDTPPDSADVDSETLPVPIDDANNYALTLELAAEPIAVAERYDSLVSWEDLSVDLRGTAISAIDVRTIELWWLQALEPAQVLSALEGGPLTQGDIALSAFGKPPLGTVSVHLNQLASGAGRFEPEEYLVGGAGTWLLLLKNDAEAASSFQLLTPEPGGVTGLAFANDSATLTFAADLDRGAPVAIPPGETPRFDWSRLTVDARGAAVVADGFDQLTIARFDADAASLEADFAHLELLASEIWSMSVKGETSAASARLQTVEGGAFPGISGEGTWLLWLGCRSCLSFAPPVVIRLTTP